MAFIALKSSRRFIARITFQSVRILQVISCPVVLNVYYSRVVKGKEVILLIMFSLESEQREQVFIILSSVNYRRVYFNY